MTPDKERKAAMTRTRLLEIADELEEQHTYPAFWSAVDDAVSALRAIAAESSEERLAAVLPTPYTAAHVAGEDRDLFTAEQMRAYAAEARLAADKELKAASILMHAAEKRAAEAEANGKHWHGVARAAWDASLLFPTSDRDDA
jgi:hypothetical protein